MKLRPFRWPAIATPPPGAPVPPLWIRLAWLAGIWIISIVALLLVAWILRLVLKAEPMGAPAKGKFGEAGAVESGTAGSKAT